MDDDISKKHLKTIYDFCYFQYLMWDSDKLLKIIIYISKQKNMQNTYIFALLLVERRHLLTRQYKMAEEYVYKAMQIFEDIENSLGAA